MEDGVNRKRISKRPYFLAIVTAVIVHACAVGPTQAPGPIKTATTIRVSPSAQSPAPQTPAETPTPAPTPVPLAWNRIWEGQEIARDIVTAMAIDPRDPAVIYIGTENSGLYKTVDGGASWRPIQNGMRRALVTSLAIDPQYPDILYAGFSEGILQTTDGGESWETTTFGFKTFFTGGRVFLADPRGHEKMYFTDGSTLYAREGTEWFAAKAGDACPGISSIAIHPSDANVLLASQKYPSERCAAGVYLSEDGGHSWKLLHSWERGESGAADWLINPQGKEEIYAIAGDSSGGDLYVSLDRGSTWRLIKQTMVKGITPTSSGCLIVYAGNSLYKATNQGTSWERLSMPMLESFHTVVVSPHDPNVMYLGGEFLLVSTDGGRTLSKLGTGIGAGRFDVKPAPDDSSTLYVQRLFLESSRDRYASQLFRSNDAGHTWKLINDRGLGLELDADGQTIYRLGMASGWGQDALWRSSDRGETWQELSSLSMPHAAALGIIAHPTIAGKLYAEIVHENNEKGFLVSPNRGGFWRTVDWKWAEIHPEEYGSVNFKLLLLPFQNQAPQTFIFQTTGGDNMFRSVDEGGIWSRCGAVDFIQPASPDQQLIIDPRDSNHLYIAARDGAYVSADGCQSWNKLTTPTGLIHSLAIDPNNPDTIYAGTDGGAYVSSDDGRTWGRINDGLIGTLVIYSIAVDSRSNAYAAAPYGVFKLERR
jgi:photosystem II stability/assembly factor-like uncharacterized protein